MSKLFLSVQDYFGSIFVDSYVFAMYDRPDTEKTKGQYQGSIPTQYCDTPENINTFFERNYFDLNKKGYGIHFTPNGVKNLAEKNRKHNFSHINAWYLDIDIEDTKQIKDYGDEMYRQERKDEILGTIFGIDHHPSLTVETRNGYHLYWFAAGDAKPKNFDTIQRKLLTIFERFGGDEAACGIMHSLRVPYFRYYKNGEEGVVKVDEMFSSLNIYSETTMLSWLAGTPEYAGKVHKERVLNRVGPELENDFSYAINVYHDHKHGIFTRAEQRPVRAIIKMLSGRPEVKGDVFSFQKTTGNKLNILANGQTTPNWIDEPINRIFSNTEPKFCVIHHFLQWYGHTNKEIAQLYYKLGL